MHPFRQRGRLRVRYTGPVDGICGALQTDLLPSWIEALATCGAFVAAVVAGFLAYGLFKVEQRRDDAAGTLAAESAKERRQEQASKVTFWLHPAETGSIRDVTKSLNRLMFANGSGLPVSRVEFGLPQFYLVMPYVPPLVEPASLIDNRRWVVKHEGDPQSTEFIALEGVKLDDAVNFILRSAITAYSSGTLETIAMRFTDSNGRRWQRTGGGRLTEIEAQDPG